MDNAIQSVTISILPIIFAITLHEAAHGYVARYFGDSTAFLAGRISLNPLRHIDPIGTVLFPIATLLLTGMLFGYAKPVPVNFNNLRDPKRDMRWVALAGPASNLVMAIGWTLFLKLQIVTGWTEPFFMSMAKAGIWINILFMVLNLIPIPPLDGSRVAFSLMPPRLAWQYARIEPFGIPLVFLFIYLFGAILIVPARLIQNLLGLLL
jgi:Zn-dependent protease